MSRALIPLEVLANDLCADIGDSTYKHRIRFTRNLVNGYRRLNMFMNSITEVKTVVLAYDNAINLPCSFLYVTKVGIRRPGYPCIAILTLSNDINRSVLSDSDCCQYLSDVWSGGYAGPGYTFYNAWGANGYYFGELYGMGRTVINNGTYSINKSTGTLYIGSNCPPDSEIVVEYVGTGLDGGLKYVPTELKEVLEFYAKWRHYMDNNPSMAQMNHELYKKEYNILKRYYNHRTPLQIATAVNQSISPTNY